MVDETRLRALLDHIGDELTHLHRLAELGPVTEAAMEDRKREGYF